MESSHTKSGRRVYSLDDLVELLKERQGERTIGEFAEEIGISPSMLSNVLCRHRRADGESVLRYLRVRKVEMYEQLT